MERFYESNNNDIEFYIDASSSIKNGLNSEVSRKIFTSISLANLTKFYVEVRKTDGSDYEPSCLKIMLSSLDR